MFVVGAWRCGQRETRRPEEGRNASTCWGGRRRRSKRRQDAARQAIPGILLALYSVDPVCGDEIVEIGHVCVKAEVSRRR